MPDYRSIYNDVITREENYNLAQNSPGFLNCVAESSALSVLSGRVLDVGCGVGFAMEYLAGPPFRFEVWGVDASDVAVQRAHLRMARFRRARAEHIQVWSGPALPHEDDFFSVVTCFDMLEHLDETDIDTTLREISRTLRKGGLFFGSVSCRPSGLNDQNGENLHRSVRGVDWWIDRVKPDRATYDALRGQLTLWMRNLKPDKQD